MARARIPHTMNGFPKPARRRARCEKGPDHEEWKFTPEEKRLLLSLDAPERMAAAQIVYSAGLRPGRTRF